MQGFSDSFILCANQKGEPVKNQRGLRGAKRLFFVQLSLVAVCSGSAWGIVNTNAAWSMGLGGLVSVLPQVCFAVILFSEQRARFSKTMVTRFYRGEALKLMMSATLFAMVFRFGQVVPVLFFMGYILAQGVAWFAPLFFRTAVTKASMSVV